MQLSDTSRQPTRSLASGALSQAGALNASLTACLTAVAPAHARPAAQQTPSLRPRRCADLMLSSACCDWLSRWQPRRQRPDSRHGSQEIRHIQDPSSGDDQSRRPAAARARHESTAMRDLQPCGTEAAARRHRRHNEPVDQACAAAAALAHRLRVNPDGSPCAPGGRYPAAEIRNGAPEPGGYRYGMTIGNPRYRWALAAIRRAEAEHGAPERDGFEAA